jgi:hypothetical protein
MTGTHHHAEEAESRLIAMLRTAFGPTVAYFMEDRSVKVTYVPAPQGERYKK